MTATATSLNDRLPPYSAEAEKSVLGSMLRDNGVIDDVLPMLGTQCFYTDAHQKIYQAIFGLAQRNMPVDLVTVAEWLNKRGFVQDIGGYSYLAELWDASPAAANALYYARIVKEKHICRSLIHAANGIMNEAYQPYRDSAEMVADAERSIMQVAEKQVTGDTVKLNGALNTTLKMLDRRLQGNSGGQLMLTGWYDLDEKTAGLHGGELIIVAARPSVGKTSLAINMLSHFAVDRNTPCFFASLEQSRMEIGERLLSMHSGVPCHVIRKGALKDDDVENIRVATDRICDAPLTIDDTPNQSMVKISANARRLKSREQIGMMVVDYLQLVEPENKRDTRNDQIGGISRRLKILARELNIPVVCLCQLSRDAARQDKPQLHHLRDSGNIEQDADTVMLLSRPEESQGLVEVDIAKQRNGPIGSLTLAFNKSLMRFENFAPEIR